MATYSITGVGTTGFPASGPNVRVISEVVDFSATTNAARIWAKGSRERARISRNVHMIKLSHNAIVNAPIKAKITCSPVITIAGI